MNLRIAFEWDGQCGLMLSTIYPFREQLETFFKSQKYGDSISRIGIIMNCMGRDVRQRKRFKKDTKEFTYDILLDYFLIKNVEVEEKKNIIRRQTVEISEQTFSKYKFDDFDNTEFLTDFKKMVNSVDW